MSADDTVKLKQYFENDPPSFFDHISNEEDKQREKSVSAEVRDLWPHSNGKEITVPVAKINSLPDPILNAVTAQLPADEIQKRKKTELELMTFDDRGLNKLINEKNYRAAIALTGKLLENYGQGFNQKGKVPVKHSIHSLQLWYTRIGCLLKIGELDTVNEEMKPFDNFSNSDMFYQHQKSQFNIKYGSLVPFSFRLLMAELPLRFGKAREAITNLTELLKTATKIRKFFEDSERTEETNFWVVREKRILYSLINCGIQSKSYDLIHQLMQAVIDLPQLSESDKFEVFSAWGKIYLQCGDITSAEKVLARCKPTSKAQEVARLIDKGLVSIADNNYLEALKAFEEAIRIDENNILVLNNIAVCYLYTGRMHEAIKFYEKAIYLSPIVNEALLLNCVTLYELQSNDSKKKKHDLLKLVNERNSDFEVSTVEACLKL